MNYSPIKNPEAKPSRRWWPVAKVLLGVATAFTIVGALLLSWMKTQKKPEANPYDEIYASPSRNFQQVPFDMLDATHYCESHTRDKYGEQLAMAYVDEHSTRFDADKGLYKIFMVAHIGDLSNYKETAIYCFVDKYRYKLTHYRAIDIKDNNLITRVRRFFQN